MPLTPPWPIDVLKQLHATLDLLRKQATANPRDSAIPAIVTDVEAAIAKVEPLAKAATQA